MNERITDERAEELAGIAEDTLSGNASNSQDKWARWLGQALADRREYKDRIAELEAEVERLTKTKTEQSQ